MNIKNLILCFSLAFAVSLAATPLVKSLAYKIGAVDVPKDARRVHKTPIPRLGGLAIFYGFLVAVLSFSVIDTQLRGILIGTLLIVGVGMVDDVKQLSAKIKLLVQLVAACITVFHGVEITALSVPEFLAEGGIVPLGWLAAPITVIWIIGVTNAVNLIDGLDGLAVGVSSIATFSLFFIAILAGETRVAILAAALAGGCIGFLPYNFNPAKIFMGDTGSTLLGYVLSVICIQGLFKGYAIISFIVPFLILGLPVFDTCFAIGRRIWNHKPIMGADRGHLHHKLMDMGFSQKQTVAILYVIAMLLGLAAVVVVEGGAYIAFVMMAVVLLFILFGAKLFRHKSVSTPEADIVFVKPVKIETVETEEKTEE
ncbi:MAG: undecaprenyl/decaprenyl-phosphate alpha-N-acetylglucosaminyl 1-phosphate transferase [Ruminococcaceae bacterium]|nr:undecaprenyl/decaprenyl-phosphate alpha-N-acetylglucosaminyl 1-phosphate transferase [Oscillospiraceae bacterium]